MRRGLTRRGKESSGFGGMVLQRWAMESCSGPDRKHNEEVSLQITVATTNFDNTIWKDAITCSLWYLLYNKSFDLNIFCTKCWTDLQNWFQLHNILQKGHGIIDSPTLQLCIYIMILVMVSILYTRKFLPGENFRQFRHLLSLAKFLSREFFVLLMIT